MIDYSAAGPWKNYVRALAIIETGENPNAPPSDDGKAYGILRQHPAFIMDYWQSEGPYAVKDDTMTVAQIKAAACFFERHLHPLGLDLCVQAYNVGLAGVQEGRRNLQYLENFKKAYAMAEKDTPTPPNSPPQWLIDLEETLAEIPNMLAALGPIIQALLAIFGNAALSPEEKQAKINDLRTQLQNKAFELHDHVHTAHFKTHFGSD